MLILSKNIRWLLPILSVVVLALHILILFYESGQPQGIVIRDSVLSTVLLSLSAWCIYILIDAYPTRVAILLYAIIVGALLCGINMLGDVQILRWWLGAKSPAYNQWLIQTLYTRVFIYFIICEWIATYAALNKKTLSLQNKFAQQTDAAILLRDAELFKLRQQLQPHFLYNSLNSISALTMIQPEKAQEMIGRLSEFLRSSVKRESEDMIAISDELDYIQAYLAIESIRFGDRLKVIFDKQYTDDAKIPPFLLQPILENAIKYGLYGKTGNVTITMHIKLQDAFLIITVTNPYDPQTKPSKGTGFGLEGIQRRLYLLYARTDLLETEKDNETFTTILKIPQAHV